EPDHRRHGQASHLESRRKHRHQALRPFHGGRNCSRFCKLGRRRYRRTGSRRLTENLQRAPAATRAPFLCLASLRHCLLQFGGSRGASATMATKSSAKKAAKKSGKKPAYTRILLKLSGESLQGPQ